MRLALVSLLASLIAVPAMAQDYYSAPDYGDGAPPLMAMGRRRRMHGRPRAQSGTAPGGLKTWRAGARPMVIMKVPAAPNCGRIDTANGHIGMPMSPGVAGGKCLRSQQGFDEGLSLIEASTSFSILRT
jgi:hypothetical protein